MSHESEAIRKGRVKIDLLEQVGLIFHPGPTNETVFEFECLPCGVTLEPLDGARWKCYSCTYEIGPDEGLVLVSRSKKSLKLFETMVRARKDDGWYWGKLIGLSRKTR